MNSSSQNSTAHAITNYSSASIQNMNQEMRIESRHSTITQPSNIALQGHWSFRTISNGLSMHYGEVSELTDMSVSAKLPPGLSFNLIFSGEVNLSLSGKPYCLGQKIKPVECSAFAIARPTIMVRHLQRGAHFRKLNLFAEQSWLEERCTDQKQVQMLARIFCRHCELQHWQPSVKTIEVANGILDKSPGTNSFNHNLEIESAAISLLSNCIDELIYHNVNSINNLSSNINSQASLKQQCKLIVDKSSLNNMTLDRLSFQLNMSVSTLQRRFKSVYGITAMQYLRGQRLDKARNALLMKRLTIGEAAYMAGYNHTTNFVAAFKKHYQLSPTEYLQKNRSAQMSTIKFDALS